MIVKVKNLGIISEAELEFKKGLNIIVGSSSSGKSTLLRGVKNLIDNSFTDSSISSGKTSMSISIENNGHIVEYLRDLNNAQRKSMYTVDGIQYTKVGRLPLQQVYDAIGIRSFEIDGTNVYFNMSSQFSAPFLVLESKSFLYSVLTYRSSFDITRINDLYYTDLKEVKKSISEKEIEKKLIEENINGAKQKLELLNDVPVIYDKFQILKNKDSELSSLKSYIKRYHDNIEMRKTSENNIEHLSLFFSLYDKVCKVISDYEIIHKYSDTITSISDSNLTVNNIKEYLRVLSLLEEKHSRIKKLNNFISLYKKIDLEDSLILLFSKLDSISSQIIHVVETNAIKEKLHSSQCNVKQFSREIDSINSELSCISVCPLCGASLNHI